METDVKEYPEGRPALIVTMTNRELLGMLLRDWYRGDTRWARMAPCYQYGLGQALNERGQPVPNVPPIKVVHPAYLLEGGTEFESAVVSVLLLDPKTFEYQDLMKRGEQARREIAMQYSHLHHPQIVPPRLS